MQRRLKKEKKREKKLAQAAIRAQKVPAVDFNDENMDDRERVIAALEQSGWVQAKAARLLNMTPRQIAYRILTLDITMKQIWLGLFLRKK